MKPFKFKRFTIQQENSTLKVGTDAMILGAILVAQNPKNCLDIGAGTGVIALMLAQNFESARIFAIEPDKYSFLDCCENFTNSSWSNRLSAIETTIQDFKTDLKFDLIATNPPFYEDSLLSADSTSNLAKHASVGMLQDFFIRAEQLLSESGAFWIILPNSNRQKWIDYAQSIGLFLDIEWLIHSKPSKLKRCVLSFTKNKKAETISKNFLVRNTDNNYSEEYKQLTKDFHFNKL